VSDDRELIANAVFGSIGWRCGALNPESDHCRPVDDPAPLRQPVQVAKQRSLES